MDCRTPVGCRQKIIVFRIAVADGDECDGCGAGGAMTRCYSLGGVSVAFRSVGGPTTPQRLNGFDYHELRFKLRIS